MSSAWEQVIAQAITIEKGVPLPERTDSFAGKKTSRVLEAARSMEVGDSIVLPADTPKSTGGNMSKATGFKFSMRRQTDKTIRIWRVA